MTNKDFIPRRDSEFNDWQKNLLLLIQGSLGPWGIPAAQFATLQTQQTSWTTAWTAASNKKNRTPAQTEAKLLARKPFEKAIRRFLKQWVMFNASITDDQRRQMSLHVADTVRTRVAVPALKAPRVAVEKVENLRHQLRITDPDNPKTRGKPGGIRDMQIFRYIGTAPPADSSAYTLVADATRFLYVTVFSDSDVGKKAWYLVRYVNTRGETGPFSDAVSAMII